MAVSSDAELVVAGSLITAPIQPLPKFIELITSKALDYFQEERLAALVGLVRKVRSEGNHAGESYYLRRAKKIGIVETTSDEIWFNQIANAGRILEEAELDAKEIWEDHQYQHVRLGLERVVSNLHDPGILKSGLIILGRTCEALQAELKGTNGLAPARTAAEIVALPRQPWKELIRHRFICRGHVAAFVGQTGIGKSVCLTQSACLWAIGRAAFSMEPTGCLRSLIFQSENDDEDLAEMLEGVCRGLSLSEEERAQAFASVRIVREVKHRGHAFISEVLEPHLEQHKPEITWIDPAIGYVGMGLSEQEAISSFLREGIGPIAEKYQTAVILVCHTPKPLREPPGKRKQSDHAYAAFGSVEWANFPRAIWQLETTHDPLIFRLRVPKRGRRLRWVTDDEDRIPTVTRVYSQANTLDGLCWHEITEEDARAADVDDKQQERDKKPKQPVDLLALVPREGALEKRELTKIIGPDAGIPRERAEGLLSILLRQGDLHEWKVRAPGTWGKLMISRHPKPEETTQLGFGDRTQTTESPAKTRKKRE